MTWRDRCDEFLPLRAVEVAGAGGAGLAGDSSALAYLVPPGTHIAAAAGRWELVELTSVSAAGPSTRAGRLVLATVQARDVRSRAVYALRYRVRLVRRDRWYVADLNGPGRGTR